MFLVVKAIIDDMKLKLSHMNICCEFSISLCMTLLIYMKFECKGVKPLFYAILSDKWK
jgi:hypothetical protein